MDGNANHKGRVLTHPAASTYVVPPALPALDESDCPNDLSFDERKVWLELAPHAIANGTLTDATALSFRLLCRNVVLERAFANSVNDKGSANHRGILQRVDAELLRFNLSPCGKPMVEPVSKPVADPREAKYFG